MLDVQGLSKKYGKKIVLQDISFTLEQGDIIGLIGENGAGKSTMLRLLATLEKPTKGSMNLYDHAYGKNQRSIQKQIGFVPQEIAIWENFSVRENMIFFAKLGWKSKSEHELRELCRSMELDKWHEPVKTLSGGMKRKLNLAISLIHDPDLLLLDEPTAGIDLKSKTEISTYLQQHAKHEKKGVMYTSHDMDEIVHLCDHVFCIGDDPFYHDIIREAGKPLTVM